MPTFLREGPYRFFFYSDEGDLREPPHVHVTAGERLAKFWLDLAVFALNKRLRAHELKTLQDLVERHQVRFLEA